MKQYLSRMAARSSECPRCGALIGEPCKTSRNGKPRYRTANHHERVRNWYRQHPKPAR